MISSSLVALVPFVLTANALLFEPPSALSAKRNTVSHHRRAVGVVGRHGRRASGDKWVSAGCRTDNVGTRALSAASTTSDTMTNDDCKNFCDQAGYSIAATEWSKECWCDNEFHFGEVVPVQQCDYMCSGNPAEVCGGAVRMTVWTKGPTVLENYGGWSSQGCFIDSVGARIVPANVDVAAPFTPQRCMDKCASLGYSYAGLEFMHECFCANNINAATLTSTPIEECNAVCDGDQSHYCGNGNRLLLYHNSATPAGPSIVNYGDWTGKGCYTDTIENRALSTRVFVDGDMTIGKCTAKCLESNFAYAGVEYATECYCGNTIGSSGLSVTDGCNMACTGANNQNCGGSNRLNVFEYSGSPSSTTTTTTTAPTSSPTVAAADSEWTYQDCYSDEIDNRSLGVRMYLDGGMTASSCMSACFRQGYMFAGVEYADECYCSNTIASSSGTADGCTMACSGDSTTLCGGPDRLNLYKYTGINLPAAPTVLASYNNWYSKGCYTDSVINRALTVQSFKDSMTVEMCIDACANAGHIVAGLEFGTECYCGDALPTTPATDNCIMPCGGDSSHICGGPNRLNVYQKRLEDPWAPWQWSGCKESLAKSIMSPKDLSHTTTMTIQQCTSYCEAQNMVVAMITANMDCQCGSLASVDEGDATCNKPCSGDPTQFCGVDGQTTSDSELITVAASVYVKPTTQPVLALPSGQGVTTYKGCYAPTGMAFVPVAHAGDIWTHEFCSDMCKGEGMPISALSTTGTFQGSPYLICSCSDHLPPNPVDASQCDKPCPANAAQKCGGANAYSVSQRV